MASSGKISKELCEWSQKELKDHYAKLCKIVAEPQYLCPKCGRVADEKKWLCKSKKLKRS